VYRAGVAIGGERKLRRRWDQGVFASHVPLSRLFRWGKNTSKKKENKMQMFLLFALQRVAFYSSLLVELFRQSRGNSTNREYLFENKVGFAEGANHKSLT
jgi:hypothetical protein